MRSEFENSLGQTDGFHNGYVRWNEISNQYESSDEDYCDVAEWMNGAFAIYEKQQSKVDELQKRVYAIKKIVKDAVDSDGNSSVEIVWDGILELEQALKGGEV